MVNSTKLLLFTGSYSPASEAGVRLLAFEAGERGVLRELDGASGVANPTFVAVDAHRRRLYAIGERVNEDGVKEGDVLTYAVDAANGRLTEVGRTATMAARGSVASTTCHISLDPAGDYAVVCSYHGGQIGLVAIDGEGNASELKNTVQHEGAGTDPERQDRPHPHSAIFSPDGKRVFVSDLGLDTITGYAIDRSSDKLVKLTEVKLPPGSGPRHLAFHPDGRSAYVINEINSTVSSFQYHDATGELTLVQTLSTLPEGFDGENTCAEIAVSPDGRTLYGSNRGHDSIALFRLDASSARLEPIGHTPTRGGHPRHFALTPDGSHLIAANRDGDNLVVFAVDAETGSLTYTGHEAKLSKPVCVKPVLFELA